MFKSQFAIVKTNLYIYIYNHFKMCVVEEHSASADIGIIEEAEIIWA